MSQQPQSTIITHNSATDHEPKRSPDDLSSTETKVLPNAFELPNPDNHVPGPAAHPVSPAPNAEMARVDQHPTVIMEEHYSDLCYEVELYVMKHPDRLVIEATLTDPDVGESVNFWDDGTTVGWEGMLCGQLVNRSLPSTDFYLAAGSYSGLQEEICGLPCDTVLTWLAAIDFAICGVPDECGGDDGEPDGSGDDDDSGEDGKAGEGEQGRANI